MRSLFFKLSTSPNATNLSIGYSEKYIRVYSLKRIPLMNFDKHYECKGVHNAKVTKLKNKWLINIKSFLNSFCIAILQLSDLIIIIWFLLLQKGLSKTFETILYYLLSNPPITANHFCNQHESKW